MDYKECAKCGGTFQIASFVVIKKTGKPRPYCRPCLKKIAAAAYLKHKKKRAATNQKYRNNPANLAAQRSRVREWHYQNAYGISEEFKREMENAQGNRCGICRTHFDEMAQRRVHVDHCHATGQIRGILCHSCNQVLGQAKDNISVLESAIKYLRDFHVFDPCREGVDFNSLIVQGLRSRHDSGKDAFA